MGEQITEERKRDCDGLSNSDEEVDRIQTDEPYKRDYSNRLLS